MTRRNGQYAATSDDVLRLVLPPAVVDESPVWIPTDGSSGPVSVRDLVAKHPKLREPVVDRLLRRGETMNAISTSKVGKSWLVTDLALSVVTGLPWLGMFETVPGSVLIIDNELHAETSAHRIPKVGEARGLDFDQYGDRLLVDNQRGHQRDIRYIGRLLQQYDPGTFQLVIIDAWYKALPVGINENDNAQMAGVYGELDAIAARADTSIVVVHHSSKGGQSEKRTTDVGSGAGSQSRAADTHLVLRAHQEENAVVLDVAARSWPPVAASCLRWKFPVWNPAPDLDPAKLKRDRPARGGKADGKAKPERVKWTAAGFVNEFITADGKTRDQLLVGAKLADISGRECLALLGAAEADGLIYRWKFGPRKPERYSTQPQPLIDPNDGGPA